MICLSYYTDFKEIIETSVMNLKIKKLNSFLTV